MNITITGKDVADAIAAEIAQATGTDCEALPDYTSTVIVYHHHTIARVASVFGVIAIIPFGGLFAGEVTKVPQEARTIDGIKEIAHALEEATAHVLSAAMHR